jgi:hypothetical protein
MRRFIQLIFAIWFSISMTMAQVWVSAAESPDPTYFGADVDEPSTYSTSSDSHASESAYTPERHESEALTQFLKRNKLPLVGAQVLRTSDGHRMVVLYGFVGSDFGKSDATRKARRFLHDRTVVVDNRINVRPELLASNHPAAGSSGVPYASYPPSADSGSAAGSSPSTSADTSAYPGPDSYKAQQASPYAQQLTSMLPLIALLGVFSLGPTPFGASPYGSPYVSPYASPFSSPFGPPSMSPYGPYSSPYGSYPFGVGPPRPVPYPYP